MTQAEQEERANSQGGAEVCNILKGIKTLPLHNPSVRSSFTANIPIVQVVRFHLSPQRVRGRLPLLRADLQLSILRRFLRILKILQLQSGPPEDLSNEVNNRLSLIQAELAQPNPDTNLVKSDLMNASRQLDRYISATLNKDSKVVENWVNALFLQDIDFKYNENNINPQFLVKFPEGSTEKIHKSETSAMPENVTEMEVSSAVVEEQVSVEEQTKSNVFVPEDKELKTMFLQSKRLAYANEPKKAIANFQKALERAEELGDTETGAKIYYEVGKIYDDHDIYAQALKSYNMSLKQTTDNNVKTKAHYAMGQIYDDVNQIKPALDTITALLHGAVSVKTLRHSQHL